MGASPARKRSSQVDYEVAEEDEYYVTRPHSSVRRYDQPAQRDTLDDDALEQKMFIQRRRASSLAGANSGAASKAIVPSGPLSRRRVEAHARPRRLPLVAILFGMVVMAALALGVTTFGSWWRVHQDDVTYGRPRTYQVNAVVGHNDGSANPSHFIFLNLNGHVVVMEFPGGDSAHAIMYSGPTLFGNGDDLIPVTGEFRDVNGDGKPDMIVHIQDQNIVFINAGTKFRPLQPGEHISL